MSRSSSLGRVLGPSLRAAVRHWPAMLAIQLGAVALVVAYYQSESVRRVAAEIIAFKVAGGWPMAFAAGFAACGVVPEVAKQLTGRSVADFRAHMGLAIFTGCVYGLESILVDGLYWLLALWFGEAVDLRTLVLKVLADMLIFAPIISIPTCMALFEWRRRRYRLRETWVALGDRFYRDRVLPALAPCWIYWTPILFCIYALPTNLQLPVSLLALAAWSIVLVFIATETHAPPP